MEEDEMFTREVEEEVIKNRTPEDWAKVVSHLEKYCKPKTTIMEKAKGIQGAADRLKELLNRKESFTRTWVKSYRNDKGVNICSMK